MGSVTPLFPLSPALHQTDTSTSQEIVTIQTHQNTPELCVNPTTTASASLMTFACVRKLLLLSGTSTTRIRTLMDTETQTPQLKHVPHQLATSTTPSTATIKIKILHTLDKPASTKAALNAQLSTKNASARQELAATPPITSMAIKTASVTRLTRLMPAVAHQKTTSTTTSTAMTKTPTNSSELNALRALSASLTLILLVDARFTTRITTASVTALTSAQTGMIPSTVTTTESQIATRMSASRPP